MKRWPLLLPLVAALVACARAPEPSLPAGQSPGPTLVVERWLQAANTNDLRTMTQLFGTHDRTIDQIEASRERAERRMHVLASLLRHQDYTIMGQRVVPGRLDDAIELLVELTLSDRVVTVPHLVVRKRTGGWIIERVDLEQVTGRGQGSTGSTSSTSTPPSGRG